MESMYDSLNEAYEAYLDQYINRLYDTRTYNVQIVHSDRYYNLSGQDTGTNYAELFERYLEDYLSTQNENIKGCEFIYYDGDDIPELCAKLDNQDSKLITYHIYRLGSDGIEDICNYGYNYDSEFCPDPDFQLSYIDRESTVLLQVRYTYYDNSVYDSYRYNINGEEYSKNTMNGAESYRFSFYKDGREDYPGEDGKQIFDASAPADENAKEITFPYASISEARVE